MQPFEEGLRGLGCCARPLLEQGEVGLYSPAWEACAYRNRPTYLSSKSILSSDKVVRQCPEDAFVYVGAALDAKCFPAPRSFVVQMGKSELVASLPVDAAMLREELGE